MGKTDRQSNIELLRIITIFGVIILHYNNPGIGGAFTYASGHETNMYFLYFMESVFICAVDLFMIISGYFLCLNNTRNLWKVIELLVQVILFSITVYFVRGLLFHETISVKGILDSIIPNNYFVILYCTVFIISPFINILIDSLKPKSLDILMIITVCLFLAYPTMVDVLSEISKKEIIGLSSIGMYGSQWGYTFVNFAVMYFMGAYLRKRNSEFEFLKKYHLLMIILGSVSLIFIWAIVNDRIGFFTERSAWEYCNPLVVTEAAAVFLLFSKMDLGVNKVINKLSEAVFTVYLLQNLLLEKAGIGSFAGGNVIILAVHMVFVCVVIYLLSWIIHIVYHFATDNIFKAISKKIDLKFTYVKSVGENK